jgi:hypothetical protein
MSLHRMRLAIPLIACGLALACGASKTQDQMSSLPPNGHGQLALALVDAPAQAEQVWVTITGVNVHHSATGWQPVAMRETPLVVDLLKLQDSAMDLGLLDLPPGTVTQIRLVVDPGPDSNYVVLPDDTPDDLTDNPRVPLKVPSGAQSGIKIHGPWEITACARITLTIDFDAHKSIWYHPTGQGDLWILRPVIRVKSQQVEPVGCAPEPQPSEPVACDPTAPVACAEDEVCLPSTDASLPDPYYCAEHPGDDSGCTAGAQCISGTCDPEAARCGYSDPGQPCYAGGDCQSARCDLETHTCEQGGGGAPCDDEADCQSGSCDPETFTCAAACTVEGLPPGATCSTNEECQSSVCGSDGKCDMNHAYDPCRPEAQDCDAAENLSCIAPDGACIGMCVGQHSQPG